MFHDQISGVLRFVEILVYSRIYFLTQSRSYRIITFVTLFTLFGLSGSANDVVVFAAFVFINLFYYGSFLKKHFNKLLVLTSVLAIITLFTIDKTFLLFDPNTYWRTLMWIDSIMLSVQNFCLGVGFGTEYHALDLHYLVGAVNKVDRWLEADLQYLQGPHNSFVSIFLRLGIVGLLGFVEIFQKLINKALTVFSDRSRQLFVIFNLISLILYIAFNVTLESPRFLMGVILSFSTITYFLSGDNIIEAK